MKIAMIAALNNPATGTVTNQATNMFRKRCQSTAFRERIQPTATTEPTCRGRDITFTGEHTGETFTDMDLLFVIMCFMYPEPFLISFLWRPFYVFIIYATGLAPFCKEPRTFLGGSTHTRYRHSRPIFLPPFQHMLGSSHVHAFHLLKLTVALIYITFMWVCTCHSTCVGIRGLQWGLISPLPPRGAQSQRSGCQAVRLGDQQLSVPSHLNSPVSHQN